MLLSVTAVTASTYLVRPDGTGDYATIQNALDAAVDEDIIELADGTFFGPGNRDLDFLGKQLVVRSQSGDAASCTIDCQGSESAPHRGFVFHSGEDPASTVARLTIRNGHIAHYLGGGGILIHQQSAPTIEECIFVDNYGNLGGGVAFREDSAPVITGCVFENNDASGGGGIFGVDWYSSAVISLCSFVGNTALAGGGAYFDTASPAFSDCRFEGNAAANEGGALFFMECFDLPSLQNCWIAENSAGIVGGGMYLIYTSPDAQHCVLADNVAALKGGGICMDECYAPVYRNFTFVGNSAPQGAGLFVGYAPLTLENCIVAFGTGSEAIRCEFGGTAALLCCDVFGNTGGDWVGCLAGQPGVDGNIGADPLFCDLPTGDYTIRDNSPCVAFSPPNPACDLIGALDVGCTGSAVERKSWSAVKTEYRLSGK